MKQAIAYIRISDKDQSNFSLAGQEKYIRDHCTKNNIHLLEIFTDDGKSARSFDRPDWNNLEQFIKQHYRKVDFLIVIKYDRFARNTAQGLQKIEMLEKKFNIVIISVFEQMFVDADSPYFFKQRADMLVNAEFEWHVIRDRTRFGMHEALSSGRYISKAPVGYINARDERKKPILIIDERKAPAIQQIFADYMQGLPFTSIQKKVNASGLNIQGRSAVPRVLSNCVYAGLIHVPSYRKEPAKHVKGLHQGIIAEELFWRVQQRLGKVPRIKSILNDAVPLRGVLQCNCGKHLTAGESKGKLKYYWYYKCNDHPKPNFSANKLHSQFDEVLNHFSFNKLQLNYLHESAEKQMHLQLKERQKKEQQLRRNWHTAFKQLESLEEKFINDEINASTYQRWYNTYKSNEATLRFELERLSGDHKQLWKLFIDGLFRLQDVKYLYHAATITEKHALLKQVFNSGLTYSEGVYRTPYLLSLFKHNALVLKEKRLLFIEQPSDKVAENSECARNYTIVEHLQTFFELITTIKTA